LEIKIELIERHEIRDEGNSNGDSDSDDGEKRHCNKI
jgi:hypothetical protein